MMPKVVQIVRKAMPASTTSGTMKINCRGKSRRGGCAMGDDDILNRVARVGSSEREKEREKRNRKERESE